MVNPSDEIYKKRFVASVFLTLIYSFMAQLLSYPISLIPILLLASLSFGYMAGVRRIGAYPLGAFLMSLGFAVSISVSTYLGIYKEMMTCLVFFSFVVIGAGVALPAEEDWGYIHG